MTFDGLFFSIFIIFAIFIFYILKMILTSDNLFINFLRATK